MPAPCPGGCPLAFGMQGWWASHLLEVHCHLFSFFVNLHPTSPSQQDVPATRGLHDPKHCRSGKAWCMATGQMPVAGPLGPCGCGRRWGMGDGGGGMARARGWGGRQGHPALVVVQLVAVLMVAMVQAHAHSQAAHGRWHALSLSPGWCRPTCSPPTPLAVYPASHGGGTMAQHAAPCVHILCGDGM